MTNEEQNERYWLEITPGSVLLHDGNTGEKRIFTGPDRLLAATAELNRLNYEEEHVPEFYRVGPDPITPAEFLSKKLPAVARRQRIEGHLAEVREIEDSLTRVLAEDAANLQRATALREKLERVLSGPLSSTEAAQNAPGVGEDTIAPFGFVERLQAAQRALNKSQPY